MLILVIYGFQSVEWQNNINKILAILKKNKVIQNYFFINDINQLKQFYNSKIHKIIYMKEQHLYELLNNGISDNLPTLEVLEILNDKLKFHHFMTNNHLEEYCPKLYNKDSEFEIAIVKKRIGEFGEGYYVVQQNNEILHSNDCLVEEYIKDNKEYVTHVLAKDGQIVTLITYEYTMYKSNYIKSALIRELKTHHVLLEEENINIFSKIIKLLNYSGFCCFNYKIINNIIKIFEINPRIGGSLAGGWSFIDGYNFFYLYSKIFI